MRVNGQNVRSVDGSLVDSESTLQFQKVINVDRKANTTLAKNVSAYAE